VKGDWKGGLVEGVEVLVNDLPDLVNFGVWNATLRDARVKAAVVDSIRDAVATTSISHGNFSQAIAAVARRSASRIGSAVVQVTAEQHETLMMTMQVVDVLIKQVSLENRSHSEIAVALFGAPESPLLDLLTESSPRVLVFLMPGLDVSKLDWLRVFHRPEVLSKLKAAIQELEPPLTARGVAGQLLGNPALREELLRQATEELAPGFEAMVEHIAGPAAKKGVEFFVSAVLTQQ